MYSRRPTHWLPIALTALLLSQLLAPLHLHDLPGSIENHTSEHQCPACNHGEDLKHGSLATTAPTYSYGAGSPNLRPTNSPVNNGGSTDNIRAPPA